MVELATDGAFAGTTKRTGLCVIKFFLQIQPHAERTRLHLLFQFMCQRRYILTGLPSRRGVLLTNFNIWKKEAIQLRGKASEFDQMLE